MSMDADIPTRVDTPLPIIDCDNIWQKGVDRYQSDTGVVLPEQLDNAISPDFTFDLIDQRHSDAAAYTPFAHKIRRSLESPLVYLRLFSIALWEGDDSPFKPAKQIFAAVVFLFDVAKNDAEKYATIIELFYGLEKLFSRLTVYVDDRMEIEVQEAMAELLAEALVFIGFVTNALRDGILTESSVKILMGDDDFYKFFNYMTELIKRDGEISSTALLLSCTQVLEAITRVSKSSNSDAEKRKEIFQALRVEQSYLRDVGGNLKSGRLYMRGRQASWDDRSNGHIFAWLGAPDPSSTYYMLQANCAPDTGLWLTEKEEFKEWKTRSNSVMFLSGPYGCGKSFLCSTVVNTLHGDCIDNATGVAYFFFDIYDHSKLTFKSLLTGLVAQICVDFESTCAPLLKQFYEIHDYGKQPPFDEAIVTLFKAMVLKFQNFYIVIDDMEECNHMGDVIAFLETMKAWKLDSLHIFLSGNLGPSNYPGLEQLLTDQYQIKVEDTNLDISLYISHRVSTEAELGKWSDRGKEVLYEWMTKHANGIFQWAHCQLQSVQRARSSISGLMYYLREMPFPLDEAYKYLFTTVDEQLEEEGLRLFPWMAYCLRPVTVREYCTSIEFSVDKDPPVIDDDYKLRNPYDGLTHFPNLLMEGSGGLYRPTHGSIRKTLEKGEIIEVGTKQKWSGKMDPVTSHLFIAKGCLAYLLQFDNEDVLRTAMIDIYPLAVYAAQYWFHHVFAYASIQDDPLVEGLLRSLFTPKSHQFKNWVALYDLDKGPQQLPLQRSSDFVPNALYYASLLGLKGLVKWLIDNGEDPNAKTGFYGNALQVAAVNGHTGTVKVLVDKGADVNATGGFYHTALQAASFAGKKDIVQLLLKMGAEVGLEGGYYGKAWKAAKKRKHSEIAQMLQEHAEVL